VDRGALEDRHIKRLILVNLAEAGIGASHHSEFWKIRREPPVSNFGATCGSHPSPLVAQWISRRRFWRARSRYGEMKSVGRLPPITVTPLAINLKSSGTACFRAAAAVGRSNLRKGLRSTWILSRFWSIGSTCFIRPNPISLNVSSGP
jgi:hypothetical protein